MKIAVSIFSAVILLSLSGGLNSATAGEPQMASLSTSAATATDSVLQRLRSRNLPQVVQAGCGLCTNVDCCGGSSNGWKLCRSNCSSGYKCMQVATCP